MQRVRFEVIIDRPVDEVFAYVTDLRNDIEWFQGIKSVHVTSIVDHGVGTEYEQDTFFLGWRFMSRHRVTEYIPPARMTLLAIKSATPFTALYLFEPVSDGRSTRFVLDAQVIGSSVYRYFGRWFIPLLVKAVDKRIAILKAVLEGQRPPIRSSRV